MGTKPRVKPRTNSDGSMTYMPTYYEILGLPQALHDEPNLPAQTLRIAYRRALLQNHPDKSSSNHALNSKATIYSIDQISEAFNTLSNPKSRTKYDQELKLQSATTQNGGVTGELCFGRALRLWIWMTWRLTRHKGYGIGAVGVVMRED